MRRKVLTFFFLISSFKAAIAQEQSLVPRGTFLKDSVAVGEHILYSLKYTYPKDMDLIFPDSTYNYFPFEFVSKKFFPTRADSTFLTDSVVYTLTTFELDPVLYLSTPVFVLKEGDSVKYFSNIDSAYFDQVLDSVPQEPKMLSNTSYVKVSKDFNYIYFLIGFGVFSVIVVVLIILFGKKIINWLRIRKLERAHKRFSRKYSDLVKEAGSLSRKRAEDILRLWKSYMERLERRPFTKLTTKEISFIYNDNELNRSLKEIDRALYSDYIPSQPSALFGNLAEFSNARLNLKIEELKNG